MFHNIGFDVVAGELVGLRGANEAVKRAQRARW